MIRVLGWLIVCGAVASLATSGCSSNEAAPRSTQPASGVRGRVFLGPTCPVQREGERCGRPYHTTIGAYSVPRHALVKSIRSDRHGRFTLRLKPGSYILEGTSKGGPPTGRPTPVKVRAHAFTAVVVLIDSGLR